MPAPLRIAFCITDLDVGGAERCLVDVVRRLDRARWQPRVFCLSPPGELAHELAAADVPVTCLDMQGLRHAHRLLKLAAHLRQWRPLLLQSFLFHGNMGARIAGRIARVPVIVSGIRVAERQQRWHVRVERWTRGLVDHHICVSQAVADFAIRQQRLAPQHVTVIPNGVDAARFAGANCADPRELGLPADARIILAVGRLHRQKGHDLLIDAAAPLLHQSPDLHLLIIGDGPERAALQHQIEQRQLTARIHLVGRRDDVPAWLKAATLFVLASRWEGMPNVVLEALAAGTPLIATDVEGVRELVDIGTNGRLIPPENPQRLHEAISEALCTRTTGDGGEDMMQLNTQIVLTTGEMADRYAQLYTRLLTSGGFVNA